MFKTICALLKRKTIKPSFPVKPEIKKELVKKATTRKPKKETASHPDGGTEPAERTGFF